MCLTRTSPPLRIQSTRLRSYAMYKLRIERPGKPVEELLLDQLPITMGRTGENDIPIKTREVSRLHARISRKDDAILIEDLDSSNGTHVNGKRIKSRELHTGDKIRIGDTSLIVESDMDTQPVSRNILTRSETASDWKVRLHKDRMTVCPQCRTVMNFSHRASGETMRCAACDKNFEIPAVDV